MWNLCDSTWNTIKYFIYINNHEKVFRFEFYLLHLNEKKHIFLICLKAESETTTDMISIGRSI